MLNMNVCAIDSIDRSSVKNNEKKTSCRLLRMILRLEISEGQASIVNETRMRLDSDQGFRQIAETLETSQISSLFLYHIDFHETEAVETLLKILCNASIIELELQSSFQFGFSDVLREIISTNRLESLIVHGLNAMIEFKDYIKIVSPVSNLRKLDFAHIYEAEELDQLLEVLGSNQTLTSVSLDITNLENTSKWKETLKGMSALNELKLVIQLIDASGEFWEPIFETIASKDLHSFSFWYFGVDSNVCDPLTEMCLSNKSLRKLCLKIPNIPPSSNAMFNFARVMSSNSRLSSLDLSGSCFGQAFNFELAKSVFTNSSLDTLILRSTFISSAVVNQLRSMIEDNISLTHLDLSENNFMDADIVSIAESLKLNKALCYIDLRGALFKSAGRRSLHEMMTTNKTLISMAISTISPQSYSHLSKVAHQTENLCFINFGYKSISRVTINHNVLELKKQFLWTVVLIIHNLSRNNLHNFDFNLTKSITEMAWSENMLTRKQFK
jgi:hypothetical protein